MKLVIRLLAATALMVPLALAPHPATAGGISIPALPTVPGLPIPSLPTDLLVPGFVGHAANAHRIAHAPVPQNPYLSPNGTSGIHDDAYSSDAYDVSGPLGRGLHVSSASYGVRECATAAFDSHGRFVGLCGGLEGFEVMVIDPRTLQAVDQLQLSRRDLTSGANPFTDICGGTYFFLDQHDHAFATTIDGSIAEVDIARNGTLSRGRTWHLAAHLPTGDCLVATGVDWSGRVWFVSRGGTVGTLDRRTGSVHTRHLDGTIVNSISSDETGGVYLVTTRSMYRLDADRRGRPQVTWRQRYDRGSVKKPGNLSRGSGTSPTLIGRRWVAINDNADPRTDILVYDRRRGVSHRLHCSVPVFTKGASTTENSLVATGRSVIAENNYGYAGIASTLLGKSTTPGLTKVAIGRHGCHVVWTNHSTAPTSVAKASLGNGLLYAYTKPSLADGIDAWYVTAIDIRTGRTVWSKLTGTGIQWNNHYAAIYLGPDGTLYIATLTGLVRLEDS